MTTIYTGEMTLSKIFMGRNSPQWTLPFLKDTLRVQKLNITLMVIKEYRLHVS